MTDLRPVPARPADPVAAAEAAAMLLRTGRTSMALTLLESLPELIRAALDAARSAPPSPTALQLEAAELTRLRSEARELVAHVARLRGEQRQAEAELAYRRRELAKLDAEVAKRRTRERLERPPSPPVGLRHPKPHRVLAAALADGTATAERVAEVLGLRPRDVPAITAGKVGLAKTAWRRLLAAVEGGT